MKDRNRERYKVDWERESMFFIYLKLTKERNMHNSLLFLPMFFFFFSFYLFIDEIYILSYVRLLSIKFPNADQIMKQLVRLYIHFHQTFLPLLPFLCSILQSCISILTKTRSWSARPRRCLPCKIIIYS